MMVVESYQKYPRRIARVFIKIYIVFTSWRYCAFEGKSLLRLTQVEVVNDSGRKLPKVPPKDGESIHFDKGI